GRPGRLRPGRLRHGERRVLTENRLLQFSQLRPRLDPQLLDEHSTRLSLGIERLCLASAPVQGEDQQGAEMLAQGMFDDQRLELWNGFVRPPESEGGVDSGRWG